MKRIAIWGLWLWAVAAWAQTAPASEDMLAQLQAQRQQLQAQRTAIEQANDGLQRDCWQRFAVNACLREVRRQRHAALDPLRQQELELNAQERALRTAQRNERLGSKQEALDRKP